MGMSFKDSASFGKRMEYYLVGQMLMEKLDVYMPLVDDHGVDCVIEKKDVQMATYVGRFCGAKRPRCGAERPLLSYSV